MLSVFTASLCLAFVVVGPPAKPAPVLPAALNTKTQEMARAFQKKDVSWFDQNTTSDFVTTEMKKKFNKKQTLEQMTRLFGLMTSVSGVTAKIVRFKKEGSSFVVTTETTLNGFINGPDGKNGKLIDASTDDLTWIPAGKGWKLKLDVTVGEHATFNGKPLGPEI
jgi:hypothetical protein